MSTERGQSWTAHNSETAKSNRSEFTTEKSDLEGDFRQYRIQERALSHQDEVQASQGRFGEHRTAPDRVSQDSGVFREISAVTQEEERTSHEQKLAKMETETTTAFQQKVQEKESRLPESEEELYTRPLGLAQLQRQRIELEELKSRLEQGRPIEKQDERKQFSLLDRNEEKPPVSYLNTPKEMHTAETEHIINSGDKPTAVKREGSVSLIPRAAGSTS